MNKDKTKLIHDAIAAGASQYGMQTFDQSIFQLYKKELITLRRGAAPGDATPTSSSSRSRASSPTSDMATEEMERTMQSFDLEQ